ncbi:MAG: hypothetical protein U0930_15865 [Pirellulales bacterium]
MGFIIRTFAAFCVATVIAQLIILGIMAAKGNLHRETVTQALALINGIDVTGANLEKVVKTTSEQPAPTYEEVLRQRAMLSQDLQLRQDALTRESEGLKKSWESFKTEKETFDRRREEFFAKVDEIEKKVVNESLQQVQRMIEELAPDQAKEQLLKMLEGDRMDDVVAITQVMSSAKRKKVLGEFVEGKDPEKLHEVLMRILQGEPMSNLISTTRKKPSDAQ